MRVLHFCDSFSPVSETFIYNHIVELERQGIDNHVATLHRDNAESRPFAKVHPVRFWGRWHPERVWQRALIEARIADREEIAWPTIRRSLDRIIRDLKPDVIHAHFGPSGVLVAPAAHRFGVPLVVTFLGFDATRLAGSEFWHKKYLELWPVASAVTGLSRHLCDRLRELGAPENKLSKMSIGVRLSDFQFSNPADRFDGRNVECLFVGRLVEKKAPVTLAKAFHVARTLLPSKLNLILHIVGDGPLLPELREFVDKRGLGGSVQIHGALDHQIVRKFLGRAHLYLQHSVTAEDGDQEGQGVTLVEASACGLPIVSTRHDGIPDVVIDGKTGFLVEENDFETMGHKIAFLASQPELWKEMGRKGRTHVEKDMDLQKQTKSWIDLYQGLCTPIYSNNPAAKC